MAVLLIRHADAGGRWERTAEDHHRPLSDVGWAQASSLRDALATHALTAVLSSPLLRCVQTVEPLAAARGLAIDARTELAEGNGRDAFDLVERLTAERADVALCSHGDVIPDVLDRLAWRGFEMGPGSGCAKASVWMIEDRRATYLGSP